MLLGVEAAQGLAVRVLGGRREISPLVGSVLGDAPVPLGDGLADPTFTVVFERAGHKWPR